MIHMYFPPQAPLVSTVTFYEWTQYVQKLWLAYGLMLSVYLLLIRYNTRAQFRPQTFNEPNLIWIKVAGYSFSRSIPLKFEHAIILHCHKQRFGKIATSVVFDNSWTSRLSIFYHILNHKNFIPKIAQLYNALTNFTQTSRPLLEEKAPINDFGRTVPSAEKYCCQ